MIFNQQTYITTNYGDEEIVQDRIASQKFMLDQSSAAIVRNEIQKQTLQSEESLYNFFDSGIEKEWYTLLPAVEQQNYSTNFN